MFKAANAMTNFGKASPHEIQMDKYKEDHLKPDVLTTSSGKPIYNKKAMLTVGPRGPALLQDFEFLEEMSHFDRERVPERVVHANGYGVHGYFEVTQDITKYCKAKLFSEVGKKTPVFVRFSTVAGERGSADTVRDIRGFAIKFYTEEGNWDLLNLSLPVFFVKDAILFPSAMRVLKRNPVTHLKDPNMSFDFWAERPESVHVLMFLFGDRGIPDGYRCMNGYSQNPLKMVNKNGDVVYVKFHIKASEFRCLPVEEAHLLEGVDPDYAGRDLYDNIEKGNYPTYKFMMQVMTMKEADNMPFNPFDITKVWPHKEFPLIEIGKLVLDRNVDNSFEETEQAAFNPAALVPGLEISNDKALQGRTFAYQDTQFHRIGPNFMQLKINSPYRAKAHSTRIDGFMCYDNGDGAPVYHPNKFNGFQHRPDVAETQFECSGKVSRYDTKETEDNFIQARVLWHKVYDDGCRSRFVQNVSKELRKCTPEVQERVYELFGNVDEKLGQSLRETVQQLMQTLGMKTIVGV